MIDKEKAEAFLEESGANKALAKLKIGGWYYKGECSFS